MFSIIQNTTNKNKSNYGVLSTTYIYSLLLYWNILQIIPIQFLQKIRTQALSSSKLSSLVISNTNLKVAHKLAPSLKHTSVSLLYNKPLTKLFHTYINIAFYTFQKVNKVHHSFGSLYMSNSSKGVNSLSITRLYMGWVKVYTYLYNLYSYGVSSLFFGTSFFKHEISALNWLQLSNINFNYKYSKLLLALTVSNKNAVTLLAYKLLNFWGFNNALILDFNYHNHTLSLLRKLSIFTFAITPTNYNSMDVDLALPSTTDSVFVQLFFIRFVVKINYIAKKENNTKHKNIWLNSPNYNMIVI